MSDKNIKDDDILERLRRLEEQVLPRGMNPADGGSFSQTITDDDGSPIYDAEQGLIPVAKIDPQAITAFNYTSDTKPSDAGEGETWYDTGADAAYVFTDDSGTTQKINIVSHAELSDVTPYAHQQPFYRQDSAPSDAVEGALWITEVDGAGNDTISRYQYNSADDVWELDSAVGPSEPTLGTPVPGSTWRDTLNGTAKQYDGGTFVNIGVTNHDNLTNVSVTQHSIPRVENDSNLVTTQIVDDANSYSGGSGEVLVEYDTPRDAVYVSVTADYYRGSAESPYYEIVLDGNQITNFEPNASDGYETRTVSDWAFVPEGAGKIVIRSDTLLATYEVENIQIDINEVW